MTRGNGDDWEHSDIHGAERTEQVKHEVQKKDGQAEHEALASALLSDKQELEWAARTRELQAYSIEELFKQHRYVQAALRLERSLIDGEPVLNQHLTQLPLHIRRNSPFIMQEIAYSLLHNGMLLEAKQAAQLAVRGFAALYMPQSLLTSLALIGRIKLRMGEFEAAAVIVEQLRREFEEKQKQYDIGGEIARCLALGKLLLPPSLYRIEDEQRKQQALPLYRFAIQAYILRAEWNNACQALTELAWNIGSYLEAKDWEWLHLQCLIACSMNRQLIPYLNLVKLVERYYKQHWWNMFLLADELVEQLQQKPIDKTSNETTTIDLMIINSNVSNKRNEGNVNNENNVVNVNNESNGYNSNNENNINSESNDANDAKEQQLYPYWLRALKLLLDFSSITGMYSTTLEQMAALKPSRKKMPGQAELSLYYSRRNGGRGTVLNKRKHTMTNASVRLQEIAEQHEREIKQTIAAYTLDIPLQYELKASLVRWNKSIGRESKELVQQLLALEEILHSTSRLGSRF